MEWEDLYDEYGFGEDPDGLVVVSGALSMGGFADADSDAATETADERANDSGKRS